MASSRRVLITGGAGFLGVNAASAFAGAGWLVTVLDNLSRPGTERNLDWLTKHHAAEPRRQIEPRRRPRIHPRHQRAPC